MSVNNNVTGSWMTSSTPATLHGDCVSQWDNIHEQIKGILLIPLAIFIIVTNGLVLVFIALERKCHRPTYFFVTSLCIADMCVGIVSIGTIITKANEPTLDLCLVRISFTVASIQASTMCILGIAVDRYIAITRALRYTQLVTATRAWVAILWMVTQSLLVGFAPLIGWNSHNYKQYCSFLYVLAPNYVIFIFIISLVPILIVFIIYVKLYCSARNHIKRIDALEQMGMACKQNGLFGISSRNWKSVKTLLCVIGCLMLTWCPFLLATAVQLVYREKVCLLKEIVGTYLLLLGFTNSFLNPLIYAVGTRDFREKFKDVIKKQCCK